MKAIVDCRGRTIDRRAVLPTATYFQYVDDTAQDPPIILATRAGLILRQQRFERRPLTIIEPKFSCHEPSSIVSQLESRRNKKFNGLIEFRP
jgi:hypothetical protein